MKKEIRKKCAVCKKIFLGDIYGQGRCECCNWFNNPLSEEHPNNVVFPNVVSLNKAIGLFSINKTIKPSIEDFVEMYNFYGEVEFTYKGKMYDLCQAGDDGEIEYGCSPDFIFYFKNSRDFIERAKTIDGQLVKDIWDKVENPKYI